MYAAHTCTPIQEVGACMLRTRVHPFRRCVRVCCAHVTLSQEVGACCAHVVRRCTCTAGHLQAFCRLRLRCQRDHTTYCGGFIISWPIHSKDRPSQKFGCVAAPGVSNTIPIPYQHPEQHPSCAPVTVLDHDGYTSQETNPTNKVQCVRARHRCTGVHGSVRVSTDTHRCTGLPLNSLCTKGAALVSLSSSGNGLRAIITSVRSVNNTSRTWRVKRRTINDIIIYLSLTISD